MELDSDRYHLICEQIKQCLLPEFDRDIGSEPLVKEDFSMFRYGLEMNLQLLFDIIAKNERLLLNSFEDDNTFRVNFILLVHEQSGYDDAPFQSDNHSIVKQFQLLIEKYYKKLIGDTNIRTGCMKHYKERLTSDKWKRNIGAIYGFVQMYKLHQKLIQSKLKSDECLFILSVGMVLADYFDMMYKKLGLILFNILLDYGNAKDLQQLNLYQVIFEKMMKPLIQIVKDEANTTLLLCCLHKCIEAFNGWREPSTWNEVDDVLEEILKRLPFESDDRCAAILILFISSITTLPMSKPKIVRNQLQFDYLERIISIDDKKAEKQQFNELRTIFSMNHNLLIARWSKKLIEAFTQRTIIGKPNEIRLQIHVTHICYLSCFYGNPWFWQLKWSAFLNDFIISLVRLVKSNVSYRVFIQDIFALLDTIKLHLENAEKHPESTSSCSEEEITEFIKSISDMKIELESFCHTDK